MSSLRASYLNVQRCEILGRGIARLLATSAFVVGLRATAALASNSPLSLQNQTITSLPVVYGCGFYTMSYQLWCDPSAVTAYIALFSNCWLANPSTAQNGGFSSLLNSSITLLPSGLVAAPFCPPAAGFTQMSCSQRTTCNQDWTSPDSNSQQLCLLLVAGSPGGATRTACDVFIEGHTSAPTAAPPAPSGGVADMSWWQILLIVVAGLLTVLLGIAMLMCLWRFCCRDGGGGGKGHVAPAPRFSSHAPDKPPHVPMVTNASLPPELALAPPASVLKMFSQRLRDPNLENPNLYVPDGKKSVPLARPSTLLPGAVPSGKTEIPVDDLKAEAKSKSAPATARQQPDLDAELVSEPKARGAPPPATPDPDLEAVPGPSAPSAPAPPAAPAAQAASAPPAPPPAAPPPLPPAPQVDASAYHPNALPGAQPQAVAVAATPSGVAAAGAVTAAIGQQPQQPQPVARSKSLFSRMFSKKEIKEEPPVDPSRPGGSAHGEVAAQPQLQLEGVSRTAMPPSTQPMPYVPYNPQQQQQQPGPIGYPWPGPAPPNGFGQQQAPSQDGGAHPWGVGAAAPPFPPLAPGGPALVPPGAEGAAMQPSMYQQPQPYLQQQQQQQQSITARPYPTPEPLGRPPNADLGSPNAGVHGYADSFPGAQQPPQRAGFGGGAQPAPGGGPYQGGFPDPHQYQYQHLHLHQQQQQLERGSSATGGWGVAPGAPSQPPLSPHPSGLPPLMQPPLGMHPGAGAGGVVGGQEGGVLPRGNLSRHPSMVHQQAAPPPGPPPQQHPQQHQQPMQQQQLAARDPFADPSALPQPLPARQLGQQPDVDEATFQAAPSGVVGAHAELPAPLLSSPTSLSAAAAASVADAAGGQWRQGPQAPQDSPALSPPRQQLQPLQSMKPPARGLQPLQPLPSLRSPPMSVQTTGGFGDPGDNPWVGDKAPVSKASFDDDSGALAAAPAAAAPLDPLDATHSSAPPRGLPAPLPLPPRSGGLAPLGNPAVAGGGGGVGLPPPRPPSGGLAPLAPLPGPRKLAPVARKTDEDDDDAVGLGLAGSTSLRGEPSFGDERQAAKGGGGGRGGLEDLEDLDEDQPAPPRRGGFL